MVLLVGRRLEFVLGVEVALAFLIGVVRFFGLVLIPSAATVSGGLAGDGELLLCVGVWCACWDLSVWLLLSVVVHLGVVL
eukprot:15365092-Ditylum_brightwellii.AAC.2